MKKKLTVGILAHVDAGTNAVERERGITIFSKQARFSWGDCDFILLDTPGHVDFSAEAERTLALLDYAILVISASDGVQNHTRTLWQLLEFYRIPTFLFVNKTDIAIRLKEDLADELAKNGYPEELIQKIFWINHYNFITKNM